MLLGKDSGFVSKIIELHLDGVISPTFSMYCKIVLNEISAFLSL